MSVRKLVTMAEIECELISLGSLGFPESSVSAAAYTGKIPVVRRHARAVPRRPTQSSEVIASINKSQIDRGDAFRACKREACVEGVRASSVIRPKVS